MPSYFVNNGLKQEIDDDLFDLLWNSIDRVEQTDSETSSTTTPKRNSEWRKQDNGYYNTKTNDEEYFKKYYQNKTKHPCVCDVCGTHITCKSNLSKHKKTKKCRNYLI